MTNIYGLFGPHDTQKMIMYVGKGLASRAAHHWKEFLSKGTAVNALLRHWFEKLKVEGVEPSWRFLEENVENWEKSERRWIATIRVFNPHLCNVSDGGNGFTLESSRLGGQVVRKLYPDLARDNGVLVHKLHPNLAHDSGILGGHFGGGATNETTDGRKGNGGRRLHELYPEKIIKEWASKGAKRIHELYPELMRDNGRNTGRKNVESGHLARVSAKARTPEHQSKAGSIGGKVSAHRRCHEAKGVIDPNCKYCRELL
jgi:hypothetical protein